MFHHLIQCMICLLWNIVFGVRILKWFRNAYFSLVLSYPCFQSKNKIELRTLKPLVKVEIQIMHFWLSQFFLVDVWRSIWSMGVGWEALRMIQSRQTEQISQPSENPAGQPRSQDSLPATLNSYLGLVISVDLFSKIELTLQEGAVGRQRISDAQVVGEVQAAEDHQSPPSWFHVLGQVSFLRRKKPRATFARTVATATVTQRIKMNAFVSSALGARILTWKEIRWKKWIAHNMHARWRTTEMIWRTKLRFFSMKRAGQGRVPRSIDRASIAVTHRPPLRVAWVRGRRTRSDIDAKAVVLLLSQKVRYQFVVSDVQSRCWRAVERSSFWRVIRQSISVCRSYQDQKT